MYRKYLTKAQSDLVRYYRDNPDSQLVIVDIPVGMFSTKVISAMLVTKGKKVRTLRASTIYELMKWGLVDCDKCIVLPDGRGYRWYTFTPYAGNCCIPVR